MRSFQFAKHLLNRTLVVGAIMVLVAYFLVFYVPDMSNGSTDSIHVPSTQTDNPVFALPVYLAKVLFAVAGPLLSIIVGAVFGIVGGIMFVVGFIRGLVRWIRAWREAPPPAP